MYLFAAFTPNEKFPRIAFFPLWNVDYLIGGLEFIQWSRYKTKCFRLSLCDLLPTALLMTVVILAVDAHYQGKLHSFGYPSPT